MPLVKIPKLLSIFLKKLKICKNKTCSIFKVLQLSQYKHFPVCPRFWNLNLNWKGDIFWNSVNSKLL
jgi:hypothetical protein